ncbi:MAG TPA: type II toxin-antitoxin system VapC family toxin [Azospirillaceae bacterium]|nr:type II toxin-antitoxin system VapC family toxin [Azospirillaceae bacterium]
MVVDSSALVAILLDEPEAPSFRRYLAAAERPLMSAVTLLEVRMVIGSRLRDAGLDRLDTVIRENGIGVIPFDSEQSRLAFDAHRRYGRGSGHAARLNMGDCAAYALASSRNLPLLYKGGDFARTDIRPAV